MIFLKFDVCIDLTQARVTRRLQFSLAANYLQKLFVKTNNDPEFPFENSDLI